MQVANWAVMTSNWLAGVFWMGKEANFSAGVKVSPTQGNMAYPFSQWREHEEVDWVVITSNWLVEVFCMGDSANFSAGNPSLSPYTEIRLTLLSQWRKHQVADYWAIMTSNWVVGVYFGWRKGLIFLPAYKFLPHMKIHVGNTLACCECLRGGGNSSTRE